jgi:hypothetical protein
LILQKNFTPTPVLNVSGTPIAFYTYWKINSNFVILPTNPVDFENVPGIARTLLDMEILNFIIHINDSLSYGHNIFNNQTYRVQSADLEAAFPDKLKNLHGYSYRLYSYPQIQTILWEDGKFYGPWIDFIAVMSKHQNGSYHYATVRRIEDATAQNNFYAMISKEHDFCVNLDISLKGFSIDLPIETFSTDGYCALIPNEPRRSFLSFILTPFDLATWILMIISLILGALLYIFSTRKVSLTSIGSFFYSIYGLFLGQGSALFEACSLKNFYFQVFVIFAFLLGTVYQSLIISFVSLNRDVYSIQSFEDLRNSDLFIYTDNYFKYLMESHGTEFEKRIVPYIYANVSVLANGKMAFVTPCSLIGYYQFSYRNLSEPFYRMKRPMISFYLKSITRKTNPFAQRMQEYVWRLFDVGILAYFKFKFDMVFDESMVEYRDSLNDFSDDEIALNDDESFEEILKLSDLLEISYILLIGYGLSTFMFALELISCFLKSNIR